MDFDDDSWIEHNEEQIKQLESLIRSSERKKRLSQYSQYGATSSRSHPKTNTDNYLSTVGSKRKSKSGRLPSSINAQRTNTWNSGMNGDIEVDAPNVLAVSAGKYVVGYNNNDNTNYNTNENSKSNSNSNSHSKSKSNKGFEETLIGSTEIITKADTKESQQGLLGISSTAVTVMNKSTSSNAIENENPTENEKEKDTTNLNTRESMNEYGLPQVQFDIKLDNNGVINEADESLHRQTIHDNDNDNEDGHGLTPQMMVQQTPSVYSNQNMLTQPNLGGVSQVTVHSNTKTELEKDKNKNKDSKDGKNGGKDGGKDGDKGKEHNSKKKSKPKRFVKMIGRWMKYTYYYKKCYAATITHFIDQVTDIAVIIEFYNLWQLELKNGSDYCPVINGRYLFIASICSLLLYRIVAAISIFRQTRQWHRILIQFFDLELFRALYVNYISRSDDPCNPQRWIQSLEAILEASPQALIQLFYLIKTRTIGSDASNVVYFSLGWSLWSIASKAISEDKIAFKEQFQKSSVKCKQLPSYFCLRKGYLTRWVFRIIDVLYRVSVLILIWLILGGFILICVVVIEFVVLAYFCRRTDELSTVTCNFFFFFFFSDILTHNTQTQH